MDFAIARQVLENALDTIPDFSPEQLSDQQKSQIKLVITGKHLTFRYILITALLGKVTDPSVHMRSLQAGALLEGAYDARSLCHSVWVPFEQHRLKGKLGASNEPYLNKPARFPSVDKTNAVRRGYDQTLLFTMYDLLEGLNSASGDLHKEAFFYAMQLIDGRSDGLVHEITLPPVIYSQFRVMKFLDTFLVRCLGGESAAAVTGAMFRVLHAKRPFKITIHPANQAGSSSNEIGDIDIKHKDDLVMAIEVKDKLFGVADVHHAIRKVLESGFNRLYFIVGRHALPIAKDVDFSKIIEERGRQGADVSFDYLDDLCKRLIALFSEEERKSVLLNIAVVLDEMRATDVTKGHFKECMKVLE